MAEGSKKARAPQKPLTVYIVHRGANADGSLDIVEAFRRGDPAIDLMDATDGSRIQRVVVTSGKG